MSDKNPNCDGSKCVSASAPVKLYPLGGGANLILCEACFAHENAYRRGRRRDYILGSRQRDGRVAAATALWPDVNWKTASLAFKPQKQRVPCGRSEPSALRVPRSSSEKLKTGENAK